ncbi:MAG: CoA-binding protein [Rhodothermia bacterium]|nr:CoA-binding protein [Rhodothermia bacterium]
MPDVESILSNATTIAIVGLSPRPTRTSHKIARYLQQVGYRIIPVNPFHEEILGEKCYPSLDAVPDNETIDIVDIFRRPRYTVDVVRDAIERKARTGRSPVIWTQIGVSSPEAETLATSSGFEYVRNRCTLVVHSSMNPS